MIVVNLIKIILVNHLLQILLHSLFTQVMIGVSLLEAVDDVPVLDAYICQLVSEGHPPWHAIVWTTKQLDFLATWRHSLDDTINLVGLATGLADIRYDYIAIQLTVYRRITFYAN